MLPTQTEETSLVDLLQLLSHAPPPMLEESTLSVQLHNPLPSLVAMPDGLQDFMNRG
jgi:hypothetical protein